MSETATDAATLQTLGSAARALSARWHLAVVAGPDPGWCHPVQSVPTTVGRDPACGLVLADPEVSRCHLEVRERAGLVEARDLGSANGTRVRRGRLVRCRGRLLGTRWRLVPPGSDLVAGGTTLRVRPRPGLSPGSEPRAAPRDHAPGGSTTALLVTASSLPLLVASGASGARLLLLAAVPAVLLLSSAMRSRARRTGPRPTRRARATAPETSEEPCDPAAVLLAAAAGGHRSADPFRRSHPATSGAGPPADADWTVAVPGADRLDPFEGGPLALVGPPHATAGAARLIICQLAVRHHPDDLQITAPCRWAGRLPHAEAAAYRTPMRALTVADAAHPHAPVPAAPRATAVLTLASSMDEVPRWCRRIAEIPADHGHLVRAAWARQVADTLASVHDTAAALPTQEWITDRLADPATAWIENDGGLAATFAVDERGGCEVDLARDGPHALVAGTTGSGKSELLVSWLLALASRYPPSALTIVAIDYKGGATFGPLAPLPHVADVLTDLDGAATERALHGLKAELARRERALADTGARDLADYRSRAGDGAPMGRLLVVVDEFRVLADEHPDLLAGLGRLAAQGRSLGIHLVLATQRPAGALGSDLRANLAISICLRVLNPADSVDVISAPDGARLPPIPGRALLRGVGDTAGAPRPVHAAWAGPPDAVRRVVDSLRAAAAAMGQPSASSLWAPPLPESMGADELPAPTISPNTRLPLLLTDRPAERRLIGWSWSPDLPLLIAGGAATGRSTALQTLMSAALNRGWPVHLARGRPGRQEAAPLMPQSSGGLVGTAVGTDDPRRLVRLLELLTQGTGPALLCIDDVESVLDACDRMGGASGAERIGRLLQESRSHALAVAVTGPIEILSARWASGIRHRLVLGPLDGTQAALAGVPRSTLGDRPPPGRGVLLGDGTAVVAHVLLPEATVSASPNDAPRPAPLRLRALPRHLSRADVLRGASEGAGRTAAVPLGIGGDTAEVCLLDVRPGARVLVTGPPESGRTSALCWVADRLRAAGRTVTWLSGGEEVVPRAQPSPDGDTPSAAALVVDDADLLDRDAAAVVSRAWRGRTGVVIASARAEAVVGGFAGVTADLRDARQTLVLSPARGGPVHLPPAEVMPHADPADPRRPGRGVLVGPRRAVPIQLPAPPAGGRAA